MVNFITGGLTEEFYDVYEAVLGSYITRLTKTLSEDGSGIIWKGEKRPELLGYGSVPIGLYASGIPYKPTIAIGGTCLLATGDLTRILKGELPDGEKIDQSSPEKSVASWIKTNLPRMDQIRDSVGPLNLDRYFVVFEDDLFAELVSSRLGLNPGQKKYLEGAFKELGVECAEQIKKWLGVCGVKEAELVYCFSSEVSDELKEAVEIVSKETGDSLMARSSRTKVDIMYTQLWIDILKRKGFLAEGDIAICSEPADHFANDVEERYGDSGGMRRYIGTNPRGKPGNNEAFSAYGFLPCLSRISGAQLSRMCTAGKVVGKQTATGIISGYEDIGQVVVRDNPIIRDSLNYLFFDPKSMELVDGLANIENGLVRVKRGVKLVAGENVQLEIGEVKKFFEPRMKAVLGKLAIRLGELYSTMGLM